MNKVLNQTIVKNVKNNSLLFSMQWVLFDSPKIETKITTVMIREYHNINYSFFLS